MLTIKLWINRREREVIILSVKEGENFTDNSQRVMMRYCNGFFENGVSMLAAHHECQNRIRDTDFRR